MEEKRPEHEEKEVVVDLDETYKAILRSRDNNALPPQRTCQRASSSPSRVVEHDELNLNSKQSFRRKSSFSFHLLVDIDGLAAPSDSSNSPDMEKINSRSSSNHLNIAEGDDESQSHLTISNSAIWNKSQLQQTFPIYLKFSDVRYRVTMRRGKSPDAKKDILHGITGSVNPGEVLALMGPSGGGKTTLLNLLSGRINIKDFDGSITYNDQPYSKWLKKRVGFVLQDDKMFPNLTVRETLTYAALLRLPKTLTKQQKEDRARNVISELGLEGCQDTVIGGGIIRGISGGERKRVCIGNEILLKPSLLFLDEPTSGLDSTAAICIAQTLQKIAEEGKTVITTIHQPSSRLFNKFDKLILLGNGNSLYFGKASEAMLYFSSIGCSPLIEMNPAEFLTDIANGNINDKSIPSELENKASLYGSTSNFSQHEGKPSPTEIHEYLVEVYENRIVHAEKNKMLKPIKFNNKWEKLEFCTSRGGAGWFEQYNILFWRGFKERRHDYLSCLRVTQVLSTAIISGLIWWHSDSLSPNKMQDQEGLLFFVSVFWGFFPAFTAIFTFPEERAMLAKERSVEMYKLSAYFIARTVSDLSLDLILPVVFLLLVYFMVGLKSVFHVFLKSMLTIFLSIMAAQGLGLAIGAAVVDARKAVTLASVVLMTFMLSGGFFLKRVPSFMSWTRYMSLNYHTYRLLLKIQYGYSNPSFIREFGVGNGGSEAGALIAMIFGYRLLAYLFLRKIGS